MTSRASVVLRAGFALLISVAAAGCGGTSTGTRSHASLAHTQTADPASKRAAAQPPQGKTGGAHPTKPPSNSARSSNIRDRQAFTKAEAICLKLNAEIAIEPIKSNSNREVAVFAPKNKKLEEQALRDLESLSPPVAPAAWRRALQLRAKLARELGELGKAAKSDDSRAVRELVGLKRSTHAKLRHVGAQAGLEQCADAG